MEYGSGPYGISLIPPIRENSGPSLRLSYVSPKLVGLPHPNIAIYRTQGFKPWDLEVPISNLLTKSTGPFLCLCHCTTETGILRDIDYIENNLLGQLNSAVHPPKNLHFSFQQSKGMTRTWLPKIA
jgi:hypothetical protein